MSHEEYSRRPGLVSGAVLCGRDVECAQVDAFVDEVGSHGAALLMRGEPGIGKSAMLDYAAARGAAAGVRVVRATGAEREAILPYSVAADLLTPLYGEELVLPAGQHQALQQALGLLPSDQPFSPFVVFAAAIDPRGSPSDCSTLTTPE